MKISSIHFLTQIGTITYNTFFLIIILKYLCGKIPRILNMNFIIQNSVKKKKKKKEEEKTSHAYMTHKTA